MGQNFCLLWRLDEERITSMHESTQELEVCVCHFY